MERQASFRSGGICRLFLNGQCRFGDRCRFRHERQSTQICRHFQKGGCWFGERCKFLHVIPSEAGAAIAGRRSSEPNVSSSSSIRTHGLSDRRGSEPALLHTELMSQQQYSGQYSASNPPQATGRVEAETVEGHLQETDLTASAQSSEAGGSLEERTSNEEIEGAAAAVSSLSQPVEISQAILQSKEQTCGICMDKIYEKPELGDRVFGILPNCGHSFCLKCIMTWRKTRDLGHDVVKTCPQCRVRSGFYVPHKYWVEGQEKESLIAAFKEKFSKKTCGYFLRHGRCPFKTDCLYRHGKAVYRRSLLISEDGEEYYTTDMLNFFLAMALLDSDEDDDEDEINIFDMPFYVVRGHFLASNP